MIAEGIRRSALAGHADRLAALSAASLGLLEIREIPFLTQINLRAEPQAASAVSLRAALGLDLPLQPNTVSSTPERSALWLGPDEWLIVARPGQAGALEAALRAAGGAGCGIVDVSANRTVIRLRGPRAADLLARGCALDLHPRAFRPGRCAQTLLAKAQVIIEQVDATPAYQVYVRASFASYLADWLLDAAAADYS